MNIINIIYIMRQSKCCIIKIHDNNIIMYLQVFLSISSFFLFSCICSPSRVSFLNALRCVSFWM